MTRTPGGTQDCPCRRQGAGTVVLATLLAASSSLVSASDSRTPPAIVRLDTATDLDLVRTIAPENRVDSPDGIKMARRKQLFRSAADTLEVGLWESGPGTLQLSDHPADEVVHLVSGELELVDETTGQRLRFTAGDHFVVPKGFTGLWIMKTKVRELYVTSGALALAPAQSAPEH